MKIVWCLGGLGNQMFQYAFYKALQATHQNVLLDINEFDGYSLHNGFELSRVFPNIQINHASKKQVNSYINKFNRYLDKLKLSNKHYFFETPYTYYKYAKSLKGDYYFKGYWQSEKYFIGIKDQITHDFEFLALSQSKYTELINNSNSVSIHVRRGDYLNHQALGSVCDLEYYKKAINYILDFVAMPVFYVFSNDLEWCKKNLPIKDMVLINENSGAYSYRDMQLMSMCKHNIIANSSFSWWGAWLNNNPSKIVITPQKWLAGSNLDTSSILVDEWIQL